MTVLDKKRSDATRARLRQICLTDLYALTRYILYAGVKTPLESDFHAPLCRWRAQSPHQRNLYLLARDHLKTSLLTVAGNVQRILRDPQIRILLASNKADTAQAQLSEIKGHLTHPLLLWLFPEVLWLDPSRDAERWTESAIVVKRRGRTKEATVETIGAEGAVTGKHFDHGTFDDLVDEHNSQTRDQLEKVIRWYQITQSLFEPDATQDIIGTPWEFTDLYAWLIDQKINRAFDLGIYRAPCWKVQEPGTLRLDSRGGLLPDDYVRDGEGQLIPAYPTKHTRLSLESRERVNARMFSAQWLLRPVDDASALFPRSKAVIQPRTTFPDPSTLWCVLAVDPAISMKEWADYSAIAAIGFSQDGTAYVLDLRRGRWKESELIDHVYDIAARLPLQVIGFEAVGFQKLYLREFHRVGEARGYLPITKLERDSRVGKATRIRALEPLWNAQAIVFADDLPALEEFLVEAEQFRPWKSGGHDDMLDALADCLQLRGHPEEVAPPDEDEEDASRRRFEHQLRLAHPTWDGLSVRNAWSMERRRQEWDAQQEAEALGVGALGEFYV